MSYKGVLGILFVFSFIAVIGVTGYRHLHKATGSSDSVTKNINTGTVRTASQATSTTQSISILKDGDTLVAGQTYDITWATTELTTQNIIIELFSSNKGFVSFLANEIPNSGNYSWVVDPKIPSGSYFVEMTDDGSMGPGQNENIVEGGIFSILSKVPAPLPPSITAIMPNTVYVNGTIDGGNYITVSGTEFTDSLYGESFDMIHLLNVSTGDWATDNDANSGMAPPTSNTQFSYFVPNSMPSGLYEMVIENSGYGLKSNPYQFTVSLSSTTQAGVTH